MNHTILDALLTTEARFDIKGNDYNSLIWLSDSIKKPTEKWCRDKAEELDREFPMTVLRQKRNALLASTDWIVLPDSPISDLQRTKWHEYRQALRDLPKGLTTPTKIKNVTWPTNPG